MQIFSYFNLLLKYTFHQIIIIYVIDQLILIKATFNINAKMNFSNIASFYLHMLGVCESTI